MHAVRNEGLGDKTLALLWASMNENENRTNQWPSVTVLISCLTKAYYDRQRKAITQPPRRQLMLYATGLAIEKVLLGDKQMPTSGSLNGIWYHTDSVTDYGTTLDEVKSTRLSMSKDYTQLFPGWHRQLLSYMKVSDVNTSTVLVLHLMGNYQPPFPDLRVYSIECEQAEIESNWQWMLDRKAILDNAIATNIAPMQYKYRLEDWIHDGAEWDELKWSECSDCPYAAICDLRERGLM